MKTKPIQNLQELQAEIYRLKQSCATMEDQLRLDTRSYIQNFNILALFARSLSMKNLFRLDKQNNLSSSAMAFVLPLLINKLLPRKSSFLTKSIVTLLSGKIGQGLNAEKLIGIIQTLSKMIKPKSTKDKIEFEDFGIPPDSETY